MPVDNDIDSQLPVRSVQDADERVQIKVMDYTAPEGADNQLKISEERAHVKADGDYEAVGNSEPNSAGLIAHDRKGTGAVPDETDQNSRPTAVTYDNGIDETIVALDMGLRDHNGVPYSITNPLPTSSEESGGSEVHDFNESAAVVAKNAADNHEYTVTALKDLRLEQWGISASGYMKGELQVETAVASGIFVTKDVLFNSTANPSEDRELKRNIKVAAGVKVRVIRYNLDNQSQAVYSFINGIES